MCRALDDAGGGIGARRPVLGRWNLLNFKKCQCWWTVSGRTSGIVVNGNRFIIENACQHASIFKILYISAESISFG